MFHSYTCIFFSSTVTGFNLWGAVVATGVVCTFYCTMVCQEHYFSFHPTHLLCKTEHFNRCVLQSGFFIPASHGITFLVRNIQSRVKFDPL